MNKGINQENYFTISGTPLRVYHYRRLDSTNLRAEALARAGEPAWTVVWADEQTAGRGRFQRQWISPARLGLWFSLILRPELPLRKWNLINLLSALVVAEILEEKLRMAASGKSVSVKWPNDVYIGGKKICGILLQNGRDIAGKDFLIVGIGINVNQQERDFPSELRHTATSLFLETGLYWNLSELLKEILKHFYLRFEEGRRDELEAIVTRFQQKMRFREEEVEIQLPNKVLTGKIVKLTEDGFLVLETERGEEIVTAGDVGIINEKGV